MADEQLDTQLPDTAALTEAEAFFERTESALQYARDSKAAVQTARAAAARIDALNRKVDARSADLAAVEANILTALAQEDAARTAAAQAQAQSASDITQAQAAAQQAKDDARLEVDRALERLRAERADAERAHKERMEAIAAELAQAKSDLAEADAALDAVSQQIAELAGRR